MTRAEIVEQMAIAIRFAFITRIDFSGTLMRQPRDWNSIMPTARDDYRQQADVALGVLERAGIVDVTTAYPRSTLVNDVERPATYEPIPDIE